MHYHEYCLAWNSGEYFDPYGYEQSDICKKCGCPLREHFKGVFCDQDEKFLFKKIPPIQLPDTLFEI